VEPPGLTASEEPVAPATGAAVFPLVPMYHWNAVAPAAETDNVADVPAAIVTEAGFERMVGDEQAGAVTVTLAAKLFTLPQLFVTLAQ
jgi:hypothetical protein